MTTSALTGGFAVCQTRLGAKIHDPKDPGSDLGPMFRQVVGTILRLADRYPEHWLPIRGSHDVPAYGFERIIDPPPLEVNTLRLLSEFHAGSLTLADTVARDARAGHGRDRPRAGGRGRPAGRPGADPARARRRRRVDHGDDPRDGRGRRRVPLPRRRVGPGHLRPGRRGPRSRRPNVETLVAALVPDLLRAGRQLRHREPRRHDRPRPRTRRAPGPRVRAAQAVPRRALGRDGRRSA